MNIYERLATHTKLFLYVTPKLSEDVNSFAWQYRWNDLDALDMDTYSRELLTKNVLHLFSSPSL